MNSKLPSFLAGFGACLLTVALGVFLYNYDWSGKPEAKRLQIEEILSTIKAKNAKEITIRESTLEMVGVSGERFVAELDSSDETREQIYKAAEGTPTKITLEQRKLWWR